VLGESANLLERVSYLAYGLATHQWPGDFDGNGYVGTSDEAHLYSSGAYKSVLGDPEYDADFDLNRDGQIDEDDLILGQVHLGRGPLGGGRISDPLGPDNPVGYSGYIFNPETGLLLARHRYYHPQLGRWMSEDWLGYVDGMSTYGYVRSSPAGASDPFGWSTTWIERNSILFSVASLAIDTAASGLMIVYEARYIADGAAHAANKPFLSPADDLRSLARNVRYSQEMKGAARVAVKLGSAGVLLGFVGAVLDGISFNDARIAGDWAGMSYNGTQVFGNAVFVSAGGIAIGVLAVTGAPVSIPYLAALGIALVVSEVIEQSGVLDVVANAATKPLTAIRNRSGTCATLRQSWEFYNSKRCPSDADKGRLDNIKEAWSSNGCPGSL
jgi:RHS repeat-associated protein